jgi:hypothetical protein
MAHDGAPKKIRWQPAALLAALAMTGATIWLAVGRYERSSQGKELHRYFKTTFAKLHAQTKSVQGAIAGLTGDNAPSPKKALELLDKNILPSIDYILEQCHALKYDDMDVEQLHLAYTQAVEGMKTDATSMRAIFARTDLQLADQHNQVQALIKQIMERFDKFQALATDMLEKNGIKLK